MRVLIVIVLALSLSGCMGYLYQPQNISEAIAQIEASGGSGCTYLRGNARPYADVAFLTVHTYGATAPKFIDCLNAIPPEAKSFIQP